MDYVFYVNLFVQAPESMKSVLSSAWLLTVAFGNLIVVVISEIKIFNSQVSVVVGRPTIYHQGREIPGR